MASANSGVNIVITGDASQAVREADKLSNALGGLKDSSVKISADSSQAVSEAERLSDVVNAVSGTHIEITADSSQAVGEVEKVANTAESIEDAHVKISADASQASEEAEKAVNALSSIGDAHSEITADGSQATDEASRVQGAIDSINGKEVEITLKIPDDWARDLDTAFNGTASRITKHFERAAEQSGNSFKEKFKEVAEAMDNVSTHFESGFGNVLMGIATKIGLLITSMGGLISSALAIGGGFEAQMTSVQVISGATAEELEKLTEKAREMGASLPISAKNAAEAMTLLVQRGTSVKDTLSTVEHVANLAISQGTDMAQATELLGSVLTNFKMNVEQAAQHHHVEHLDHAQGGGGIHRIDAVNIDVLARGRSADAVTVVDERSAGLDLGLELLQRRLVQHDGGIVTAQYGGRYGGVADDYRHVGGAAALLRAVGRHPCNFLVFHQSGVSQNFTHGEDALSSET